MITELVTLCILQGITFQNPTPQRFLDTRYLTVWKCENAGLVYTKSKDLYENAEPTMELTLVRDKNGKWQVRE